MQNPNCENYILPFSARKQENTQQQIEIFTFWYLNEIKTRLRGACKYIFILKKISNIIMLSSFAYNTLENATPILTFLLALVHKLLIKLSGSLAAMFASWLLFLWDLWLVLGR